MLRCLNLKLVIAGLVCAAGLTVGWVQAKNQPTIHEPASISLSALPQPGLQMMRLIYQGGPFETEKDGVVFANRERLLPIKTRGYYREYTVATPGLSHRGKKRIVCGGHVTKPEICYYTADHYASFRRIVP